MVADIVCLKDELLQQADGPLDNDENELSDCD